MTRGGKGLPLYLEIAEELRSRILNGELPDGGKLHSQRELAAEFGTTLMTVRKALELLEDEEIVKTEHGVGMFASAPRVGEYERERIFGFDAEMGMRHQSVSTRLLEDSPLTIPPEASRLLGYSLGEAIPVIQRLRILDGQPIVLQSSFLAKRISAVLSRYDPSFSLYEQVAKTTGFAIAMTKEVLAPLALDKAAARLLERKAGDPAMRSLRLSRSNEGDVLVYDIAVIAGDSFFVSAERIGKRHNYEFNFRKGGSESLVDQLLKEE